MSTTTDESKDQLIKDNSAPFDVLTLTSHHECLVCYEYIPDSILFFSCNHVVCKPCFQRYLLAQFDKSSKSIINIKCICHGCNTKCTEKIIKYVLTEEQYKKYQQFKLNAELLQDASIGYCINPRCSQLFNPKQNTDYKIYKIGLDPNNYICNSCKLSQCFQCKIEWHTNLSCSNREKQLNELDQEFEDYMKQHKKEYKQCQKCKIWIHHVSECLKVRCRCDYKFCFKCETPDATCTCTPANHVFYDLSSILNNWSGSGPGEGKGEGFNPIIKRQKQYMEYINTTNNKKKHVA